VLFRSGGHTSYHGGGFGFIGGGGGGSFGVLLFLALLVLVGWLAYRAWKKRAGNSNPNTGKSNLNTVSDRVAHRSDDAARQRAAQVEARVEALAETDATYAPDALKKRAVWLYTTAQRAWTARDPRS